MEAAKILLIEDDPLVLSALATVLEFRGFEVSATANGQEAVGMLGSFRPDVLITDMVMPEMDGVELIKKVRSQGRDIPILAISGLGPEDGELYLRLAQKIGADAVLRKPVKGDVLVSAIRRLLDGRHAVQRGASIP
jgi:CheY-like chemotaxis protein